jgi:hypothetical protein
MGQKLKAESSRLKARRLKAESNYTGFIISDLVE